jgi:hypothetical protein
MTYYFFKIFIEIRLYIYQFLLLNKFIPVRYKNSNLINDGKRVYTAILYINHQIYNKATGLFYNIKAFIIELFKDSLRIYNFKNFA